MHVVWALTDSFNKAVRDKRMQHWSFMPSEWKVGDTVIVGQIDRKFTQIALEAVVLGEWLHVHGDTFRNAGFPNSYVTELAILNWADPPKDTRPRRKVRKR